MKAAITIFFLMLLCTGRADSQDTRVTEYKKAMPGKKAIKKIYTTMRFPESMVGQGAGGIVVLDVKVLKDGTVDEIQVERSTNQEYLNCVSQHFITIKEKWNPAISDGMAVESQSKVVFMFFREPLRNEQSFDLAKKAFKNKNYEEAMKHVNQAISQEPYNHELYRLRSEISAGLGNAAGLMADSNMARDLDEKIAVIFHTTSVY